MLTFLQHVLPSEGRKCCAVIDISSGKKTVRQIFETDLASLAARIADADAAGQTVYHACGAYQDGNRRTHANALGARAFWLDVDAGDEARSKNPNAYADATEAAEQVALFARDAGLPPPVYVGSGEGLHVYWPLQATLPAAEWERHARGLKELCRRHGLQADPARTADISSILRTPGTHWRKRGAAREVLCGPLVGPYSIDQFGGLLEHAPAKTLHVNGHTVAAALLAAGASRPYSSEGIVAQCGQLALLRDKRGCIPEPSWYASLGVLAFCADGDRHAHEWSAGYEGYTHAETQERLDRARTLTGATTCAHFHGLNPATCEACPHWQKIKSPIVLGYEDTQAPAPVAEIVLPRLPHDYRWTQKNELVAQASDGRGNVDIVISSYPIFLDRVQVGEVRGEFSYLFKNYIPAHGWSDISIPASTLYSSAGAGAMAAQGANIHDSQHFNRFVKQSVDMVYAQGELKTAYDQFGWKDEDASFLYGLNLYHPAGVRRVSGAQELHVRSDERNQWLGPVRGGSLANWTRAANALFAAGCEAQSLALLASFASPLMRFLARDEGGAIVSLVTRRSGTGKSTALAGAASVWGRREALGLTNADTRISKFLTLGAMGNLPIVWDELETRDPIVLRDFVMTFTNGRDKMRATREGSIRHSASTWQTILISASNGSLIDTLQTAAGSNASAYRVMEVSLVIPPTVKHAMGDALQRELMTNRGWAGDAYLRWLVIPENLMWTKAALDKYAKEVWRLTNLPPDGRFWVRTTAAIAVAAAIVSKIGLLDFSPERMINWTLEKIARNPDLIGRVAYMVDDHWATDALGRFLNEAGAYVMVVPGPYKPGTAQCFPLIKPARELWMRHEKNPARLLIAHDPLRKWLVEHELGWREFLHQLSEQKIITDPRKYLALGAGTDWPSTRVLCVEIDIARPEVTGLIERPWPP